MPVAVLLKGADECEVAPSRRSHQPVQIGQAVDRFFECDRFVVRSAITVLHFAVVMKKGDVVGGRLNPQDPAAAVIHLEGLAAEVVADAGALDPR